MQPGPVESVEGGSQPVAPPSLQACIIIIITIIIHSIHG